MTYQINSPEIYDRICDLYFGVLCEARDKGYTEDIEIHVSQSIFDGLEMKEKLTVGMGGIIMDVPVIIDKAIVDRKHTDNLWMSDIYIFDPKWNRQ